MSDARCSSCGATSPCMRLPTTEGLPAAPAAWSMLIPTHTHMQHEQAAPKRPQLTDGLATSSLAMDRRCGMGECVV